MAISQIVKQSRETFSIYGGITNVAATDEQIIIGTSSVVCLDVNGDSGAALLSGGPSVSTDGVKTLSTYCRICGNRSIVSLCTYIFDGNR